MNKSSKKSGKKTGKKSGEKSAAGKSLRVTLLKSRFGRIKGHAECAFGLGLRNRHQTVEVVDTPENRGMIAKIHYMVQVEEV
jgi:large subunit ribosomal protein L30